MECRNKYAVLVRNIVKSYDEDKPVLDNFHMTVKKGSIYGLIGASGSGKSTLLNCLIGISKWNSGQVLIFGKIPGTKGSEVPGRQLGYMPQDLALYDHLTVLETMKYYGRLFGLSKQNLQENWQAINDLLLLPENGILVKSLSGGQKRRVSLALALIHMPDVIILDEPTVGLDPVLRLSIWNYLRQLVSSHGTTIIVTTHYIEETKLADTIGIMRNGKLLVEDSPVNLLNDYESQCLEDVVKSLCYQDEYQSNVKQNGTLDLHDLKSWDDVRRESYSFSKDGVNSQIRLEIYRFYQRVYGFCTVLALLLLRFPAFSVLALWAPAIQGSLSIGAVGSGMRDLKFGIVNNEVENWPIACDTTPNICDLTILSCCYINKLRQKNILELNYYSSEEDALRSVHLGKSWGYLTFPKNYTKHSLDRAVARIYASNDSLKGSLINVNMDYSNKLASFFMIEHLYRSFMNFTSDFGNISLPIQFDKPVYGSEGDDYYLSTLPGLTFYSISSIIGSLACLEFLTDLKQGTLSRSRIAGLGKIEIVLSYFITNGIVVLIQSLIYLGTQNLIFKIEINSPLHEYVIFCMLCGLYGIALGIFFGMITKDIITAMSVGLFIAATALLLGGAIFSREYQPTLLRSLGNLSPLCMPIEALTSIIVRGLGFSHPLVWPGLAVSVAWIVFLGLGSVILMPI